MYEKTLPAVGLKAYMALGKDGWYNAEKSRISLFNNHNRSKNCKLTKKKDCFHMVNTF